MDFKDVEDADIKILEEYRAWAFPQAVSDPNHQPYFSLEDPTSWATLGALKLFFSRESAPEVVSTTLTVSVRDLKAFRSLLLPKGLLSSPYFSLENRENWTKPGPFQTFQNAGLLAPQAASNPPPRSPSHLMKTEDQTPAPRISKNARLDDSPNWTEAWDYSFDAGGPDDPWSKAPSGTADDPVPVDSSSSESERPPDPSFSYPKVLVTSGSAPAGRKGKRHLKTKRDSIPTIIPISESDSDMPELPFKPVKRSRGSPVDSAYPDQQAGIG
ncbi:hypothetical protein FS837_009645 [Tulasnella sp. UAMH 9824]|nr:hypothetical protein FS837_009645 [Tulasnella sp. UAMH 9824]